ncbi:hypothetical protein PG988_002354 [Apiospora saccharicola]
MVRLAKFLGGIALACSFGAIAHPIALPANGNQVEAENDKRQLKFNFKREAEGAEENEKRQLKFNF